jgi:hypothetical protein
MLAPFTGQLVQHRGYSKPKTKVNANAWVCNIENGNRGGVRIQMLETLEREMC